MTNDAASPAGSPEAGISTAVQQLRTPTGFVLMATAFIGVMLTAHWSPALIVMLPFYFITLLAPKLARRASLWFALSAIWVVIVIARTGHLEDHVYMWVAWIIAIGVALLEPGRFLEEIARQGRYLVGLVFGFATFWKLTSGSFLSGSALWTAGLYDPRMDPIFGIIGISRDSFEEARPLVDSISGGSSDNFVIELSSYSTAGLLALSIGTVLIEALIAAAYLAPDSHMLARLRVPVLVLFGLLTYAVVPVLTFATLLALIALVIADFDRRAMIALGVMVLASVVRFSTL